MGSLRGQYRPPGVRSWYGEQAAVGEQRRGKQIGEGKDKESDQESVKKGAGECHPIMRSL